MKKNDLIIYWASEDGLNHKSDMDWGILNKPLTSLYLYLGKNLVSGRKDTFFKCPSVKNLMKQTFVLTSSMDSSYLIEDGFLKITSKNGLSAKIDHEETLENNLLLSIHTSLYFFSEEDVELTMSAPFFNNSNHLRYGAVIPGTINIGSWFRSFNIEFNLWDNITEFHIKENEPIAYLRFNTEKNIVLKQFKMNDQLTRIANTCGSGSDWEKNIPLIKRYSRFKESKTKEVVLKEIRRQLIDE